MKTQFSMMLRNRSIQAATAAMLTLLLLVALPVSAAFALDTGFLVPTSNTTGSGSASWTNPGNGYASDNAYATAGQSGRWVSYSGFAFPSIPTGSTINGIEVSVEGNTGGRQADVDLSWDNGTTYTTAGTGAVKTTAFGGSDTVASLGSATDLWGTSHTWVSADFTSTLFRVRLTSTSGGNTISLDQVRVKVYYSKATPTLSVTNSPVTYNGSPQAATVTGSVPGVVSNVKYGGSSTIPTNAGTYTVTADFTPTDTTNYNSLTGASAGNFIISKATPTLSVTNSPVTYNGSPQAATVTGSVAGVVSSIKYGGSSTVPTSAATYAVTANFVPTDTTNYNSLTGASAGNFIISKATPTLSVTNSPVTYNGSPQAATVTGSVAGVVSSIKYGGSSTVPTDAATYAVTANFVPTDTTNYNSLTGGAAGNFIIDKATPTLSVTNSPVTYDTLGHAATVSGSVPGTPSNVLTGGAATQTDAGTYAVTADFAPSDTTNYNSLTGASAGNFVVDKATPTLSVTNSPVTYDTLSHAATVSGSVPGTPSNVLTGGAATQTDAGTYAVTADFAPTDTTNYNSLTGAAAGNFIIDKADPTLSVTNSPVTYDASAHAATVSGSVPGTPSNVLTGGAATQTDAGTYAVTADFAPTDTTNYNSLTAASAGNFIIDKATPTLSVTNSPVTYNGSPQAATVTGSVPGVVSNVQYDASSTTPTDAATYAVTADFAPTDTTNYNPLTGAAAGNFIISKATPTLSVTNSPVVFDGSPHAATVSGSVPGTPSNILTGGAATQTAVGTYAVTADFAPTDATNYNSLTGASAGNFVITSATSAPINVKINGSLMTGSPFTLPVGASQRTSFAGINNGPVQIASTNAVPIIGAERVIYNVAGKPVSFTEMMGLPGSLLNTTYWMPWYNNVDLDTQLRFGNVSGSVAHVHVLIGGTEMTGSPFTLGVGASTRVSFAGINNGPVEVTSDFPIVASERVIYNVNGSPTSFSEMMGLPDSQLNTTYWMPWYNNVDLDTQLRFGNVSGSVAHVHVLIGGTEMTGSPFTLGVGASTRVSFAGINNGPVEVTSDFAIVASERVIYNVNGSPTSFSEMMGLPDSLLNTTYWMPWYNNVDLDTQLRFGNVSGSVAHVHVLIGGTEMTGSPFTLGVGASTRVSFASINNGPVEVTSDFPIVAAERVIYNVAGKPVSFTEMMGLPDSLLDPSYWMPWYNNVDLDTQLRFGVP